MNLNVQPAAPLDILAIGAHADDVEIFAGGTVALATRKGLRVGILDLTRGEAATRGTPEERAAESDRAAKILGVALRGRLDLGDGDLANGQGNRASVVQAIRRLRPRLILTLAADDRHPDHGRAHELVRDAAFFAYVAKFPAEGERWRVEGLAYFVGNHQPADPRVDWIVDVSDTFETKRAALEAYASQLLAAPGDPNPTYIASQEFWELIEIRSRLWGHRIGARHGEPFLLDRPAHAGHPLVRMLTS